MPKDWSDISLSYPFLGSRAGDFRAHQHKCVSQQPLPMFNNHKIAIFYVLSASSVSWWFIFCIKPDALLA
jgi:hypothetical protein